MSENADGRRRGGALVGRAAERETIDTLLAAAEDAQSGALVLAGPPGIGHALTAASNSARIPRRLGSTRPPHSQRRSASVR